MVNPLVIITSRCVEACIYPRCRVAVVYRVMLRSWQTEDLVLWIVFL